MFRNAPLLSPPSTGGIKGGARSKSPSKGARRPGDPSLPPVHGGEERGGTTRRLRFPACRLLPAAYCLVPLALTALGLLVLSAGYGPPAGGDLALGALYEFRRSTALSALYAALLIAWYAAWRFSSKPLAGMGIAAGGLLIAALAGWLPNSLSLWPVPLALALSLYLCWRFDADLSAVVLSALLLPPILTLLALWPLGREVSPPALAGLLIAAGYALANALLFIGRLREIPPDLRADRGPHKVKDYFVGSPYAEAINGAAQTTLRQSLLPSLGLLLLALMAALLSGPVIRDFGITLALGLLLALCSTVFVAPPLLVWWRQRRAALQAERKP